VTLAEQDVAVNREKIADLERVELEKDVEGVVREWLGNATSMQQLYQRATASARKNSGQTPSRDASSTALEASGELTPRRVRFPEQPAAIVGESAPFVAVTYVHEDELEDEDDEEDEPPASGDAAVAAPKALSWQEQLQLILVRCARGAPVMPHGIGADLPTPPGWLRVRSWTSPRAPRRRATRWTSRRC